MKINIHENVTWGSMVLENVRGGSYTKIVLDDETIRYLKSRIKNKSG